MNPQPLESWRIFFPAAAVLAILGLTAWAATFSGVPLGILPGNHAAFMIWGVLGCGVQGFLFTAYAKQNDATLPKRRLLFGVLGGQLLGAATLLLSSGGLRVIALAPWVALLAWVLPIARTSLARRWEPTTAAVPVVLLSGITGLALHLAGTVSPRGIDVGFQAFIAPLALSVLDRVLPFFSSKVTPDYQGGRHPWFIGTLLALSWLKLLPWSADEATALLLALLLRQWWGWRPWPSSKTPMIAILHLGVAWFALSWILSLTGAPQSTSTHALAVGGLGSLLLGISMRVVQGHSGLPVVLGRAGLAVMAAIQLAALARVTAGFGLIPLLWSALLFVSAFAIWLLRFAPTCIRK